MLSRFRCTGQAALPELQLYHYKARVYDPNLGRFLQTDPVGYNVDLNLYQYVYGDPLNLVDPSGLQQSCEDVGASSCRSSVGGLGGALESIESAWNQFWDTAPQATQGVVDDYRTTLENVDEVSSDTMNSPVGFALGIIFDPSPVGEARAVASGTTRLYRAVSEAEAAQIASTGVFQAGPNSLGGKWFAETIEHAREWGERLGNPVILRVDLPTARANQLMRVERLDNIGPARYGELNQLEGAVIREER
jgi:RHS repeat-associated protein